MCVINAQTHIEKIYIFFQIHLILLSWFPATPNKQENMGNCIVFVYSIYTVDKIHLYYFKNIIYLIFFNYLYLILFSLSWNYMIM